MEKTSGMMLNYVYKRIIYFNSDWKDLVVKIVKIVEDEILSINSCDSFECVVYSDSIGIYCNNEKTIKRIEALLISKLPDNILIFPHYSKNSVNFEDIRKFKAYTHLPLGQCINQAIQVIILLL